jgi:hypothetical protein
MAAQYTQHMAAQYTRSPISVINLVIVTIHTHLGRWSCVDSRGSRRSIANIASNDHRARKELRQRLEP